MKALTILKVLTFSFVLVSFFSCNNKDKKNSLILFKDVIEIAGEEYQNEIFSTAPIDIGIMDSCIFLLGPDYKNVMQILREKDATKIAEWGKLGSGPGEFITPFPSRISTKDSTIYLYDLSLNTMRQYKWLREKETIHLEEQKEIKYSDAFTIIQFPHVLDNGFTVATTFTGQKKLLVLLDKELHIVANFGDFPNNEKITNFIPYTGYFASYENKFVYIMNDIGYIVEYEIIEDGKINKRWEHFITKPVYRNEKEGTLIKDENIKGFYDVAMTEKYVICSYSGIKISEGRKTSGGLLPKTLLVFDHSGRPIKKFITKKDIGRFCLSEDGNTVYGFYFNPEVGIAKYDLTPYLP